MLKEVQKVDKPWGYELIYAHTDRYAGKILHVDAGQALSLQYHEEKDETLYLMEGEYQLWCIHGYYEGLMERELLCDVVQLLLERGIRIRPLRDAQKRYGALCERSSEVGKIQVPGGLGKVSCESSFIAEFKDGLAYIFHNRPILSLILTFAVFNFFVSPILIIIPMIVKFTLNESVTWLAVFETFFALGSAALAASLSFKKSYGNIYGWFFVSLLLMGLSFGGLYFAHNKYAVCALLFAAGAALGGGNTLALTLFQSTVPDDMKGRFFSVLTTLAYAVMPLAFMVNGMLAERFSVNFCIAMNSIAVLALSFVILLLPRIEYRS